MMLDFFLFIGFILSIIAGYGLWFIVYKIEIIINGGTKSNIWKYIAEEVSWLLPGAGKKRADYIKDMIGVAGEGYLGKWKYTQIRKDNLYEIVGWHVLPSYKHFLLRHILFPIVLPTIYLIIVFLIKVYS